MKSLYFDIIGGASGDMMLGAFLDAGLNFSVIENSIKKLPLSNFISNYTIKKRMVHRAHFHATKFDVQYKYSKAPSLSFNNIVSMIKKSRLSDRVKNLSLSIYKVLAGAERHAHHSNKKDVQFQQLGDFDSIVDIVGISSAIIELGIDRFFISRIPLGSNIGAATLRMLKHYDVYFKNIPFENVTPTAAAVLSALRAKQLDYNPDVKIENVGYGGGRNNPHDFANVLRIIIGQDKHAFAKDIITVVETNIDDMNPQDFEYVQEELFRAGALDVYTQSIQMKKSRFGILLTALIEPEDLDKICGIIFKETSTFGIRYYDMRRRKLNRRIEKVNTHYGNIRLKLGSFNSAINTVSPEYDDCKIIARKYHQPIRKIYEEAKLKGAKKWL